jgi:peptidyl-prolyl cis-trans isomerase B (cyclophilin B)
MARTMEPHSASAQFFINVGDNSFLNHSAPTAKAGAMPCLGSG